MNDLPQSIQEKIFFYLRLKDLKNLSLVNKQLRANLEPVKCLVQLTRLGMQDAEVWPVLCLHNFKDESTRTNIPPDFMYEWSGSFANVFKSLVDQKWKFKDIQVYSTLYFKIHALVPISTKLSITIRSSPDILDLISLNRATHLNLHTLRNDHDHAITIFGNIDKLTNLKSLYFKIRYLEKYPELQQLIAKLLPTSNLTHLEASTDFNSILPFLPGGLTSFDITLGECDPYILSTALLKSKIKQLRAFLRFDEQSLVAFVDSIINCKVTDLELHYFSPTMSYFYLNLVKLDLNRLHLFLYGTPDSVLPLCNILPLLNIKHLLIHVPIESFLQFLEALEKSSVTHLRLTDTKSEEYFKLLGDYLYKLKIKSLEIIFNQYTRHLGYFISKLPSSELVHLDLLKNDFDGKAVQALSSIAQSKIKRLKIIRCIQGEESVGALSRVLQSSAVKELYIDFFRPIDISPVALGVSDEAVLEFILDVGNKLELLVINLRKYDPKISKIRALGNRRAKYVRILKEPGTPDLQVPLLLKTETDNELEFKSGNLSRNTTEFQTLLCNTKLRILKMSNVAGLYPNEILLWFMDLLQYSGVVHLEVWLTSSTFPNQPSNDAYFSDWVLEEFILTIGKQLKYLKIKKHLNRRQSAL
ncbi:hypothetical protein HDV06_000788 [Boothiomyces sp. JEL0866]|nr:hypothetical protein HDV06_000788 [Boothiomyces sp. JEL0866]